MNKVVLIITSSIDETVDYIIEKYKNVSFFRLNVDFIGKYRFKINEYGWQITEDNRTITNKSVYSIYYTLIIVFIKYLIPICKKSKSSH